MKFILHRVDIPLLEIKSLAGAREPQERETDFEFIVFDPEMTGEITVRLINLPEELQKSWLDFKKGAEASLKAKILGEK